MVSNGTAHNFPLAIVGIAAELPSGEYSKNNLDHTAFFDFLLQGGDSYERIPLERFDIELLHGPQPGRIVAEKGSFLKDTALFDHLEFGITHKDARSMSLSTRKLLELSFLALLDSGINYRGKNIGCFTSGITHDILALGDMNEFEARGSFAGIPTQIANKISYHLDLTGPSIPLDTACSSTLSAMHLAIQSIRAGDCVAALVGGSQLNHRFLDFVQYTQGGVLSPDGKCKPFDASADGFSRGEAAVVVVIKPLKDALQDNDKIYATVLGTGINSAGFAAPANAPVAQAQEDAMRRAYTQANREPSDACYIEMHATGTALGDPTEANWVGKAFGRRDSPLLIGSVKGNIGHTEITAFLASLCKVVGMFQHRVIPPTINLHRPNPAILWHEYNMHAPTVQTPLPVQARSGKALISIASSGIGGSNGHCVVEEPPMRSIVNPLEPFMTGPVLLVVGALSPRATTSLCDSFGSLIQQYPDEAASLSSLLGRRVRQMSWRSFAVTDANNCSKVDFTPPVLTPRSKPIVGFVFSGQGPQHIDMGRQLFHDFVAFRDCVLALDAVYARTVGISLIDSTGLFDIRQSNRNLPEIWPINIILPSIAIIQIALVDLLRSLGVVPDVVIGHSAGETAMLYASGAISKDAAIEIAIARGQALQKTESPETTMAAVSCEASAAQILISEVRSRHPSGVLEIACHNADYAVTVAGEKALIDELVEMCKLRGVATQRLRTNVAVHSSIMDRCESDLRSGLQDVFDRYDLPSPQPHTVPAYSCVTSDKIRDLDVDYLWRNTRQPVLFRDCVKSVVNDYADRQLVIVEIGPHPVLSGYLSSLLPATSTIVTPMRRTKTLIPHHERTVLLRAVGGLVACGYNNVDFSKLNGNADHLVSFPLPLYPFQRKVVSVNSHYTGQQQLFNDWKGPLNFRRLRMNAATHPDLAEHIMNGEPIVPATGFLEMALEFGANMLWNIKFHAFLSLSHEEPRPVRVSLRGTHWSVSTGNKGDGHSMEVHKLHAEGELLVGQMAHLPPPIDILAIKTRCEFINADGIYADLSYFAAYGPCFQLIKQFHRGDGEFLVEVDSRRDVSSLNSYRKHYRLDPAILDACLHILIHPSITGTTDKSVYYLPSRCDRFFLYNDATTFTERLFAYGSNGKWTPDNISFDILIVSSTNVPICAFRGLTVSIHAPLKNVVTRFKMAYEPVGSIPTRMLDLHEPENYVHGLSDEDIFNNTLFLRCRLEDEFTEILDALKQVDFSQLSTVSFFATSGYSASACRGLTRSLRREIPVTVRLVEMNVEWPLYSEKAIATHLLVAGIDDEEVVIDALGSILVPRLRDVDVSDAVPLRAAVGHHMPPCHTSSPNGCTAEIVVRPERIYRDPCLNGICSFTGVSHHGDRVAGITSKALSDTIPISIPEDSILFAHQCDGYILEDVARYAIAALILSFTFGGYNDNLKGTTVLLTHTSTSIGSRIQELLSNHDLHVHGASAEETISDILHLRDTTFDIVLSGYAEPEEVSILQGLYPSAIFFFWNNPGVGLYPLLEQRHRVVMAMKNLLRWLPKGSPSHDNRITNDSLLRSDQRAAILPSTSMFSAHKSYLLVGGIGSLGLQVATWMYHNGARHIVLTSRSGRETLMKTKNIHALRVLRYLENLPDLTLVLIACDAANKCDTRDVIAGLHVPVAGCMLLAAVLDDKPFQSQTRDSFSRVFASKVGAYHALREALDIDTLDFLIGFTSISGMFGNAGQTNYASANTALEFLMSQHDNAFCLVTPMLLDTSIAFGDTSNRSTRNTKVQHIAAWGVSCRDVCEYIADGLHQLRYGPFSLYVPDMDWRSIHDRMGTSSFYAHLIPEQTEALNDGAPIESPSASLLRILLQILEVSEEDFSYEVPLTAYGLDSLSAQRIVVVIRPFVRVTQLQLLADMSFNDLLARMSTTEVVDERDSSQPSFIDWMKSDVPVIRLHDGKGVPLFLIPGGSGIPDVFSDIAERLTTPVYGVHVIGDAPDTLPDLVEYLFTHIKQIQPHGPYRIGGFCVGTTIALLLVEKFLQAGDKLCQVALIEGFPLLFASPVWEIDQETVEHRKLSKSLEDHTLDFLIGMYATEPVTPGGFDYKRIAEQTTRAIQGESVSPFLAYRVVNLYRSARAHGHFVSGFADPSQPFDPHLVQQRMIEWLSTFKHPMTFYLGNAGIRSTFPDRAPEWDHLGVDLCDANIRLEMIDSGHFGILGSDRLISALENDW